MLSLTTFCGAKIRKIYEYFAVMVKISFSLSAGILTAMAAGIPASFGTVALVLCCAAASVLRRSGKFETFFIFLCFFSAGIFCWCTQTSTVSFPSSGRPEILSAASRRLSEAISRAPFRNSGTTGLLKALICGDRTALQRGTAEAFRKAGAAHILALSGLHLGIICMLLRRVLSPAGNSPAATKMKCATMIGVSAFYTMMTGASQSVIRAFLFISIRELSKLAPHRAVSSTGVFCTALTVQLAINPGAIRTLGFQLSYLAMAGLLTLAPLMQSWFPGGKHVMLKKIWDNSVAAISCQAFTAPLTVIKFHYFPQYFLLSNLIALPLTEAIICSGLVSTVLAGTGLGKGAATVTDHLVSALDFCLETISTM